MSVPILRPAAEADIVAIAAIYGHSVATGTASFELEPPDAEEMLRRMRALDEAGYPYLVAEAGGTVLGYAYAGAYRPRPGYRHTVEDSVYVAPFAHRQGVGRRLLARLIEECTRLGFRQMVAVIGDSQQAASIGLHRAQGFEPAGILKAVAYKFDAWRDQVLMQRALGPGDSTPPSR